jgi:serine/threonine protein kinase
MTVARLAGTRYRVERQLGAGGMATVYLARDTELDRPVAIKVLADNLSADSEIRERFLREGRLAGRLSHPNVVAVFDAGEEDGRPYIVMEHVEGETLADALGRRGRFPPQEAVEVMLQACAGLEHAHEAGLVHRDVKPRNLLLREDGTVKVADFGIARSGDSTRLTLAGTILGTAAYLAPEQAAGEEVGPAADVYALGAVLYELLGGSPPFEVDSLEELAQHYRGEPALPVRDLPAEVPAEVEEVVMRALARLPEYRPQSAAELAAELRAALGREATTIVREREPPTEVLRRPRRRARRGWAVVAAATAALAALALVLALAARPDEPADPAPAQVEPVPPAETPEEQARNLSDWIRDHSE